MPPPTTAQVATVRQSTSVPVNCQIASRHATTDTRMQPLVVQKEIFVTTRGLRKPRFIGRASLAGYSDGVNGYLGVTTRSARTRAFPMEAVIRKGNRRESSPIHMRICS